MRVLSLVLILSLLRPDSGWAKDFVSYTARVEKVVSVFKKSQDSDNIYRSSQVSTTSSSAALIKSDNVVRLDQKSSVETSTQLLEAEITFYTGKMVYEVGDETYGFYVENRGQKIFVKATDVQKIIDKSLYVRALQESLLSFNILVKDPNAFILNLWPSDMICTFENTNLICTYSYTLTLTYESKDPPAAPPPVPSPSPLPSAVTTSVLTGITSSVPSTSTPATPSAEASQLPSSSSVPAAPLLVLPRTLSAPSPNPAMPKNP